MPLDQNNQTYTYSAAVKDLYEVAEMPPLGHVP